MTIKSQILISDTDVKLSELISTIYNVMLLAFYRAIDQSKTIFNLVNGFMDEYEDESGIDTANSVNESYNNTDDYYSPTKSGIDSNTKLMLPLDNTLTDVATDKTVTNNNVTFSSSEKKFGSYSGVFNGSSAYLSLVDSNDWDVFASASENWTIDFWVKQSSLSGNQCYIGQFESAYNHWTVNVYVNGTVLFGCVYGGEWDVIMESDSGVIGTSNWHHVACVKNGSTYGIYVDGVQVGYLSDSSTRTFSGNLQIGKRYSDYYFNGYMDDVRIQKSNIFNASPNSGKTDTITVPTQSYSTSNNLTLISNLIEAEEVPSSARIVIFEEDVDSITLNTDLKAYVSRDNGTTYTQATLEDEGYYVTSKYILAGLVDLSAQPSGSNLKYKLETLNNKNLKIHGTGMNWS